MIHEYLKKDTSGDYWAVAEQELSDLTSLTGHRTFTR